MTNRTRVAAQVGCWIAALMLWAAPVGAADADWQFTPLFLDVHSPPRWFLGTDAQVHLVYELVLANALAGPVAVNTVVVLDAASGAPVQRLSGAALQAAMSTAAAPDTPATALPAGAAGIVWLDVPLRSAARVPAAVRHRVTIDPVPGVPDHFLAFDGPAVVVDRRPPVVRGPPWTGAGWATVGSCCDGPHRRSLMAIGGRRYIGQRYAIDFNQLDAQDRPGTGDPLRPESFPTFGQPVLAVADATVATAVDRYPDLRVGAAREDLSAQSEGGNRVVLDLGSGRFAAYAHLKAGSVRVRTGEKVARGQVIAAAGSSGTNGGPHVHFQVLDAPSLLFAEGLPYVFDAVVVTGQTPPLAQLLPYFDTLAPVPSTRKDVGPRRDALPLGSDVVTFPPLAGPVSASPGNAQAMRVQSR
jgi:hypothetical protein